MRKKLLSLLLVLCMVLTLAPAAFAAEPAEEAPGDPIAPNPNADVRETDIFADLPHSGVDWEDMEYTPVTEAEFLAAIDEAKAALDTYAGLDAVLEKFHAVSDLYLTIRTNVSYLNVMASINYTDESILAQYSADYETYVNIFDPFIFLVQDILKSNYRDGFVKAESLTEEDIDSYLTYVGMTDEQKALQAQVTALQETYDQVVAEAAESVVVDGVEWTPAAAGAAVEAGEITEEQYYAIADAYLDAHYASLGELYMEVLDLNTQLAASYGYDNYGEFSYIEEYGRDFTAEDIATFCEAVREYYVPLYLELASLQQDSINLCFFQNPMDYTWLQTNDYTSDDTLMLVRSYIGQMSSELLEAYDYMLAHDLYDITASETKGQGGFTTNFPLYGSPFFFNNPYGYYADFSTILHEFGHFNNNYWHACGWNDGNVTIDVAEVHSQALEMLFIQYYDEILGSAAEFLAEDTVIRILINGVISGALMGELELYAATTEDVTLEQICDKYEELLVEYGMANEGETSLSRYDWLDIPHLTSSPMYYISYATSGSGAFSFWLEAQSEGYEAATDHYLQFVNQSVYDSFLEQFEEAGLENPLSPEYVEAVAEALEEAFDVQARLNPTPVFNDVPFDNPYNPLIENAYKMGALSGDSSGNFRPDDTTTRAEVIQSLYDMLGKFMPFDMTAPSAFADADGQWYSEAASWAAQYGIIYGEEENGQLVFNGDDTVTREMMATIVYRTAVAAGYDPDYAEAFAYADVDSISPWAVDAVMWLTENDVLSPVDEAGNLIPQGIMNRVNLASYAYNLFFLIFS